MANDVYMDSKDLAKPKALIFGWPLSTDQVGGYSTGKYVSSLAEF